MMTWQCFGKISCDHTSEHTCKLNNNIKFCNICPLWNLSLKVQFIKIPELTQWNTWWKQIYSISWNFEMLVYIVFINLSSLSYKTTGNYDVFIFFYLSFECSTTKPRSRGRSFKTIIKYFLICIKTTQSKTVTNVVIFLLYLDTMLLWLLTWGFDNTHTCKMSLPS